MDNYHEYRTFLDNDVADSLYSGIFRGLDTYASVNLLPTVLKTWVLQDHPTTIYVRIGPVCGGLETMRWWIGGFISKGGLEDWHDFITSKKLNVPLHPEISKIMGRII